MTAVPDRPLLPEVVTLRIAETPEAWATAGFAVDPDGRCRIGRIAVDLVGPDAGEAVVGWSLRNLPAPPPDSLDGLATTADATTPPAEPAVHPNGVTTFDHIVLLTDHMGRTVNAAAAVGLTPKRWRDHSLPDGTAVRQAFFLVGDLVLELVAPTRRVERPRPTVRSFGVALVCPDLDAAAAHLGEHLGTVRDAVQRGRRIATVRHRDLGLRTPIALMTPRPRRR